MRRRGAVNWIIGFVMLCLFTGIRGQNACEVNCVREIYANNCGEAQCITGIGSSAEYESLCGSACISALSGGGMLDCLLSIGGSYEVQNSFVLTVQNFCAHGDPFKTVEPPKTEASMSISAPTALPPSELSPAVSPPAIILEVASSSDSDPVEVLPSIPAAAPSEEIVGAPEPELQMEELHLDPSEFL